MKFRTYQAGDEKGLANVFVHAFAENGFCLQRNGEVWKWIYKQHPHFDPELIILAEENGKIVSKICAVLEDIQFLGKIYRVGVFHELGTLPEAQGWGTMKTLFQRIMVTLKEKEVDFMLLHSDPHAYPVAFPFYKREGFIPVFKRDNLFTLTSKTQFRHFDIKIFFNTGKILDLYRRTKIPTHSRDISCKIKDISGTIWEDVFRRKCNEYFQHHNHYIPLTLERWKWMHLNRPDSRDSRVIGIFSTTDELIGGARVGTRLINNINFPNNGFFYLPMAIWDQFVIFKQLSSRIQTYLKQRLIQSILQISAEMGAHLVSSVFPLNSSDSKLCQNLGFHNSARGYCLIKPVNVTLDRRELSQSPWYIPLDCTKGEP